MTPMNESSISFSSQFWQATITKCEPQDLASLLLIRVHPRYSAVRFAFSITRFPDPRPAVGLLFQRREIADFAAQFLCLQQTADDLAAARLGQLVWESDLSRHGNAAQNVPQ